MHLWYFGLAHYLLLSLSNYGILLVPLVFVWFIMLMMTAAGSLEKLDCSSDVLTNLASIDLQLVTTDHLYAAQTVVSQCLSDKW